MRYSDKDCRRLMTRLLAVENRGTRDLIRSFLGALSAIVLFAFLGLILTSVDARASTVTIDDILVYFDSAVTDGSLVGSGPGESGAERRQALRNMIASAGQLINDSMTSEACDQLLDALERTDDRFPPPDFVEGPGAVTLSDLILTLRLDLMCDFAVLPAGDGGTVEGPGGTTVTIAPGSVPYDSIVGIAPARSSAVVADNGPLPILAAVEVVFLPVGLGDAAPPTVPLQISAPALVNVPDGTKFVVGQQASVAFADGVNAGVSQQFIAVASGQAQDGQLTSQSNIFPGVFSGGVLVFLEETGSGYATGIVRDSTGPRAGVVVSNNTNTLVSVTNASGAYTLFISGGPFTVNGFDPFKGTGGFAIGNIAVEGSTVTQDIDLIALTIPVDAYDGIRNGGFERGDLSSWVTNGTASVRQDLVCTGRTIVPQEGQWMADINTSAGAVGEVGSAITQRFKLPKGVKTLRFDINYVSEEFPEWVGTQFNDSFRAVITKMSTGPTDPPEEIIIKEVTVNNSGPTVPIGDCGFPGGDTTAEMTDWIHVTFDLPSSWVDVQDIRVDLLFSANDLGDDIYDTHVLIDNIRFQTLWVDVKSVGGVAADLTRVRADIRAANEIISQAGLNIRLRNDTVTDISDVSFDSNINLGNLTTVTTEVTNVFAAGISPDLDVYYVNSFTQNNSTLDYWGWAIGPDDYSSGVDVQSAGAFLTVSAPPNKAPPGRRMAHEIGHLLISPENSGSSLEHGVETILDPNQAPTWDTSNFMNPTAGEQVNRDQSANINRPGAPFLDD